MVGLSYTSCLTCVRLTKLSLLCFEQHELDYHCYSTVRMNELIEHSLLCCCRAQKRMYGEDVYGHKIMVVVDTAPPGPPPGPQRPPLYHQQPRHAYGMPGLPLPQRPMMAPPFLHPPPPPAVPESPWPDYAMHQPMAPKNNGALTALFFKVLVTEVKVRRPDEVKHVESSLTELRLSVNIKVSVFLMYRHVKVTWYAHDLKRCDRLHSQ